MLSEEDIDLTDFRSVIELPTLFPEEKVLLSSGLHGWPKIHRSAGSP